jgi:NADH dehydrogenase [ubiquinone] 1 alpha subcomplex assembly factor 5
LRENIAQRLIDRLEVRFCHLIVLTLRWSSSNLDILLLPLAAQDIKGREFPVAVDLGSGPGFVYRQLQGHAGIKKLIQMDIADKFLLRDASAGGHPFLDPEEWIETHRMVGDPEWLPLQPESVDLVVSCLDLHWVNDLPGALTQIRRSLKPDGLFLAAMFGENTLRELREAFIVAETEREGGLGQHASPMAGLSDLAGLVQRAGFTLPTLDVDHVDVSYPDAFAVMEHLQGMGEQNASFGARKGTPRSTLLAAAAAYQAMSGMEEGVTASFDVVFMIGWAPHREQPKPLQRGTAKRSLKNLLMGSSDKNKTNG